MELMSPEIVIKGYHSSKSDIWVLGILLFEKLLGNLSFKANSVESMREQMKPKSIQYSSISIPVKDLLKECSSPATSNKQTLIQFCRWWREAPSGL